MTSASLPPSPLVGRRERLWPTVLVSLALHAAFIAVAAWHRPPALVIDQKPIVARLVRLGEARPKELLPRKDAAPPPAPAATAPPAPTPAPPPKVAEAPRPDAMAPPKAAPAKPQPAPGPRANGKPQPSSGGLASALSRITKEQQVYGSPDGHLLGDADEGEGDPYTALVTRVIQREYVLPSTLSDQERMHLRATVLLFIDPDGAISRYEFRSRSGNPTFDSALERAIRSARLPPPPADKRVPFRSQGLAVIFTP